MTGRHSNKKKKRRAAVKPQSSKSGCGTTAASTAYYLRADLSKDDFVIPDVECPSAEAMDVLKEYAAKQLPD